MAGDGNQYPHPLSTLQPKDVHSLIHMLPHQAVIVAMLKLW